MMVSLLMAYDSSYTSVESPIFKTVGRELHEEMMAQEEDQEQEDAELLNRDFSVLLMWRLNVAG